MSDLIKREDAIKAIKQWRDNDGSLFDVGLNQAIREIKRLPSADKPQGWIPCSERLPEEQGQYLVTTYACDDYYYVDVLSFHKGEFYSTDSEWGDMVDNDVTAWMPLPKPYEKGADNG